MRYLFFSNVGKQRPSYSVECLSRREFSTLNEKSLGRDYEGNVSLNYEAKHAKYIQNSKCSQQKQPRVPERVIYWRISEIVDSAWHVNRNLNIRDMGLTYHDAPGINKHD